MFSNNYLLSNEEFGRKMYAYALMYRPITSSGGGL